MLPFKIALVVLLLLDLWAGVTAFDAYVDQPRAGSLLLLNVLAIVAVLTTLP